VGQLLCPFTADCRITAVVTMNSSHMLFFPYNKNFNLLTAEFTLSTALHGLLMF
jgi:hypothetical protein